MEKEKIKLKLATIEDIGSILEVEKSVIGTKIYSGFIQKTKRQLVCISRLVSNK